MLAFAAWLMLEAQPVGASIVAAGALVAAIHFKAAKTKIID